MYMFDVTRAVLQRWKMATIIFCSVMVLTFLWIAITPREYRASATLLFDSRAPNPTSGKAGGSAIEDNGMLATEAQILRSEVIARKVVEKLGMLEDPVLRAQWQQYTGGSQTFEGWITRRVQSGLEVTPSPVGNTIEVSYRSLNAEKSALLANSFAQTFNDARLGISNQFAQRFAAWFKKQIAQSEQRMEDAQTDLANFQRAHGIVATGAIDAESTRLSELSSKLSSAEASAAEARARAAGGSSMPDVQSSGVIQGLRAQIATKQAEISQMGAELGPNHALMLAARGQLREMEDILTQETSKTSGSLTAVSTAAAANQGTMQSLLDQHRARMLALASDRGKLNVLESNVVSARKEYEGQTEQLAQLHAKSTAPSLNIVRLNIAEPPLLPNSPNIGVRFLMMTVLALMLALGSAILAEWLRPRVRSHNAILHLTGVPLLGQADLRRQGQQLRIEGGNWS